MSYDSASGTIHTFKDLIAWQKSHEFVIEIYQVTSKFPSHEQFGLTNQVRRAAVSIVSNIAEGFGRRSVADRARFYDMARASLYEVQAQLLVAKDVNFLNTEKYLELETVGMICHKLLTGLINKTKAPGRELLTHNS